MTVITHHRLFHRQNRYIWTKAKTKKQSKSITCACMYVCTDINTHKKREKENKNQNFVFVLQKYKAKNRYIDDGWLHIDMCVCIDRYINHRILAWWMPNYHAKANSQTTKKKKMNIQLTHMHTFIHTCMCLSITPQPENLIPSIFIDRCLFLSFTSRRRRSVFFDHG